MHLIIDMVVGSNSVAPLRSWTRVSLLDGCLSVCGSCPCRGRPHRPEPDQFGLWLQKLNLFLCCPWWPEMHHLKPHPHTLQARFTCTPARITSELFSAFIYMWHKIYFEERKLFFFSRPPQRPYFIFQSLCCCCNCETNVFSIDFFFLCCSWRDGIGSSAGVHGGCDLAKLLIAFTTR